MQYNSIAKLMNMYNSINKVAMPWCFPVRHALLGGSFLPESTWCRSCKSWWDRRHLPWHDGDPRGTWQMVIFPWKSAMFFDRGVNWMDAECIDMSSNMSSVFCTHICHKEQSYGVAWNAKMIRIFGYLRHQNGLNLWAVSRLVRFNTGGCFSK